MLHSVCTTEHVQVESFLHFSYIANETFVIESMAEADDSRVTNQQLEYPYGKLCFLITLYSIDRYRRETTGFMPILC